MMRTNTRFTSVRPGIQYQETGSPPNSIKVSRKAMSSDGSRKGLARTTRCHRRTPLFAGKSNVLALIVSLLSERTSIQFLHGNRRLKHRQHAKGGGTNRDQARLCR